MEMYYQTMSRAKVLTGTYLFFSMAMVLQLGQKGIHIVFNKRLISFKKNPGCQKIFFINSRQIKQNEHIQICLEYMLKTCEPGVQRTCAIQDKERHFRTGVIISIVA